MLRIDPRLLTIATNMAAIVSFLVAILHLLLCFAPSSRLADLLLRPVVLRQLNLGQRKQFFMLQGVILGLYAVALVFIPIESYVSMVPLIVAIIVGRKLRRLLDAAKRVATPATTREVAAETP